MTTEIDNFYPAKFRYKTVRLYDVEESDLLPHWNDTCKFIAEAKNFGGKCLVHCRMGISRSASTVCAYLMKEKLWKKDDALNYVEKCRPIICPNPGFQKQLDEFEGIIFARCAKQLFGLVFSDTLLGKTIKKVREECLWQDFKPNVFFLCYHSAQRHNKLFRSRSESSLSEQSVGDDPSGLSPFVSHSHAHVDNPHGVTVPNFDLNRRLLDITSDSHEKVT